MVCKTTRKRKHDAPNNRNVRRHAHIESAVRARQLCVPLAAARVVVTRHRIASAHLLLAVRTRCACTARTLRSFRCSAVVEERASRRVTLIGCALASSHLHITLITARSSARCRKRRKSVARAMDEKSVGARACAQSIGKLTCLERLARCTLAPPAARATS